MQAVLVEARYYDVKIPCKYFHGPWRLLLLAYDSISYKDTFAVDYLQINDTLHAMTYRDHEQRVPRTVY